MLRQKSVTAQCYSSARCQAPLRELKSSGLFMSRDPGKFTLWKPRPWGQKSWGLYREFGFGFAVWVGLQKQKAKSHLWSFGHRMRGEGFDDKGAWLGSGWVAIACFLTISKELGMDFRILCQNLVFGPWGFPASVPGRNIYENMLIVG